MATIDDRMIDMLELAPADGAPVGGRLSGQHVGWRLDSPVEIDQQFPGAPAHPREYEVNWNNHHVKLVGVSGLGFQHDIRGLGCKPRGLARFGRLKLGENYYGAQVAQNVAGRIGGAAKTFTFDVPDGVRVVDQG